MRTSLVVPHSLGARSGRMRNGGRVQCWKCDTWTTAPGVCHHCHSPIDEKGRVVRRTAPASSRPAAFTPPRDFVAKGWELAGREGISISDAMSRLARTAPGEHQRWVRHVAAEKRLNELEARLQAEGKRRKEQPELYSKIDQAAAVYAQHPGPRGADDRARAFARMASR